MTQYRTKQGDMIDAICYRYYGRQGEAVESVYEANRGLANIGPVLPAGLVITLPKLPAASAAPTVKLWD